MRFIRILGIMFMSIVLSGVMLEMTLYTWSKVYAGSVLWSKQYDTSDFVILTLGESTTAALTKNAWPAQLEAMLRSKYPDRGIHVVNKAFPGALTSNLVGNLETHIKQYKPDVIVSMMGINDSYTENNKDAVFIPDAASDRLLTLRMFHVLYREVRARIRYAYDLHLNTRADALNSKADNFMMLGQYELAEKYYRRSIELDPKNAAHLVDLSLLYQQMSRMAEAEELLHAADRIQPNEAGVLVELGWYYHQRGAFDMAEEYYKKALRANPEYGLAYDAYGTLVSWEFKDYERARTLYERAITLPNSMLSTYFELADVYRELHRYTDAIAAYRTILSRDPANKMAKRELAETEHERQTGTVAGVEDAVQGTVSSDELHAMTKINYRRLIGIAERYRIPVVAVQYPLLSPQPLRTFLEKEIDLPSVPVYVVGNDVNFQDALQRVKYAELFVDQFAGNFGHTTREGSRLIAESVTPVIERLLR